MDRRCFRKGGEGPGTVIFPDDLIGVLNDSGAGAGSNEGRIRCPHCKWQPTKSDRWQCVCSHIWHAFDTRGRCPECSNLWHVMQCLRCAEWSPRLAWYG